MMQLWHFHGLIVYRKCSDIRQPACEDLILGCWMPFCALFLFYLCGNLF